MTDGLRWVFEAAPFGYSLAFCEDLAPEEGSYDSVPGESPSSSR
ncbi:hypothetical protein ACQEVY_31985 [Streptomyces sp. CA-288835]